MKLLLIFLFNISLVYGSPHNMGLWSDHYEQLLLRKAGEMAPKLAKYPTFQYPNKGFEKIPEKNPNHKVLLFGYGSLMNKASAEKSLKQEAIESMVPVIAFGVKRIFNYKASKTDQWGTNQNPLEKAMLNLIPMTTYHDMINGVVMEIDPEDFAQLVKREKGYDLMPILIADWNKVIKENPKIQIQIAYTFIVPDEIRDGIDYTQTKYYPVRGYLHAAEAGTKVYGKTFFEFFEHTTFLANGTTRINQWDQKDFETLLKSKEP